MNHYNYFEHEYYTTKYKDLSKMNREQVLQHFKNHGIKEKRKFNKLLDLFDYTFYVTKYKDLSKMNYLEACNHYIKHGIKEKRKFNKLLDLFDYTFYVTKYKDLSKMNYLEACNHYIKHGIKEKRKCNINKILPFQNTTASLKINYNKNYNDKINIKVIYRKNEGHFIKQFNSQLYNINFSNNYNLLIDYDFVLHEWFNIGTINFLRFYDNYKLKIKNKPKIIIRLHDNELNNTKDLLNSKYNNIDYLWCININALNESYNIFKNNIKYIYLHNIFIPSNPKINNNFKKTILNISVSLREKKNICKLIDIFYKIYILDNKFRLIIKSSINGKEQINEYNKILNKIKNYNIQNNVELLLNKVDLSNNFLNNKSDIKRLYESSSYYIHTSYREGFCYSIAEAIDNNLYTLSLPWKWGYSINTWQELINEENQIVKKVLDYSYLDSSIKNKILEKNKLKLEKYFNIKLTNEFNIILKCIKYNIHIVLVAHNSLLHNLRGGEKSMLQLAEYLALKGCSITIIEFINSDKNITTTTRLKFGIVYKIVHIKNYTFIDGIKNININLYNNVSNEIKNLKPNLILCWANTSRLISYICINNNIKYVIFVRWWSEFSKNLSDIGFLKERYESNKDVIKKFSYIFENSSKVITNNKYSQEIIKLYYKINSVVVYVTEPYKSDIIYNNNKNNKYILYFGANKNMGEDKFLVYIAKYFPDKKIYIVNYKNNNNNKELHNNIPNIVKLEYVNNIDEIYKNAELLLYYCNCDVCGTSRVALEIGKYGVPCITSPYSGFSEVMSFSPKTNQFDDWIKLINNIYSSYEHYVNIVYERYKSFDNEYYQNLCYNEIINCLKF